MPLLAAWIGSLFGALWTIIQTYLIARLLLRVAAVALLYAAWSTLKSSTDSAIASAFVSLPSIMGIAATWIIPPQMPTIISLIITVESGLLAYRWTKILFNVQTTV